MKLIIVWAVGFMLGCVFILLITPNTKTTNTQTSNELLDKNKILYYTNKVSDSTNYSLIESELKSYHDVCIIFSTNATF